MVENKFLNVKKRLEDLSSIDIKTESDLLQFFIKVNSIIKEIGLYSDVALVKNEIKELVQDYLKIGGINASFQYDVPLFVNENELATDFLVTVINDKGEEEEMTADIVLQCDIELHGSFYNITPQVFFVVYDEGDENVELEEDGEVGFPDDEEGKEPDYDPEFADETVVRDFLRNIIVSKIYQEGYEYPNDETIDELVEKLVNMINDTLEETLNVYVQDEDEDEEKQPPKPEGEGQNLKKLKGGDVLEIYEKKNEDPYYFIITARYGKDAYGSIESFISIGYTEKEARKKFTEDHENWTILSVLKLEKHELFDDQE